MGIYLLRRVLQMIPTLFGVTLVTFLVMRLAPGDPLLTQMGTAGESTQPREAYLVMKRDLKLDRPWLLNFRYLTDYREKVRLAAVILQRDAKGIAALLAELHQAPNTPAHAELLKFLRDTIAVRNFDSLFASGAGQADQYNGLAISVERHLQTWCEDFGFHATPPAVKLLGESKDVNERIGLIRGLTFMVIDPFNYTYSRQPTAEESHAVAATWKLLWEKEQGKFEPVDLERAQEIDARLAQLAAEPSREAVFEAIQNEFFFEDSPHFVAIVLGDQSLAVKSIAAEALRLFVSTRIKVSVPPGAEAALVDEVAQNWQVHLDARRAGYETPTWQRVALVPADTQYGHLLLRLVTFQFGRSALKTKEPVGEKIWNAVVVSAPLMLASQALIYLISIPTGVLCAVKRNTWVDRGVSFALFVLYSVPPFVAGMMFLLFLAYGTAPLYLEIFPKGRLHAPGAETYGAVRWWFDYLWHAFLPVATLSLFSLATLAMYSRGSMLDALGQDYVRTARAKGVPGRRIVFIHALRNALFVITLFANFLPAMLGGSVLVEDIFNIPGMGRLSLSAIVQKDYPTVMALIYIDAIVVMLSILLSDVLYVMVDPRINFEAQGQSK